MNSSEYRRRHLEFGETKENFWGRFGVLALPQERVCAILQSALPLREGESVLEVACDPDSATNPESRVVVVIQSDDFPRVEVGQRGSDLKIVGPEGNRTVVVGG